ncbi:MAG: hydantoinase B/oxoprolinase family protein [Planctomycetota bacterium]
MKNPSKKTTLNEGFDAWIDVGGTFTDCFVRKPDGEIVSSKGLSSSRVPVSLLQLSLDREGLESQVGLQLGEIASAPEGFWTGADLVVLDRNGEEAVRLRVQDHTSIPNDGWVWFAAEGLKSLPVKGGHSESAKERTLADSERVLATLRQWRFELDPLCESPVFAVRKALRTNLLDPLPRLRVRMGTTRGTNALLTRRGAKTAFVVTSPFEDLLEIGDQTRSDLFSLDVKKPTPLHTQTIGVRERLRADGSIAVPLDAEDLRVNLQRAFNSGVESIAISLMHSHVNPNHEQAVASIAREIGFRSVSVSSDLAPLIEILARARTAVVDAYLNPIIQGYLQRLVEQFGESTELSVMTSAGGLVHWKRFSGKDCILSGPAGGVAALCELGVSSSRRDLIGLDMGGTSTDVCRVFQSETSDGFTAEIELESEKAGVQVLSPSLPIETVASGGGSICWFDGSRLRVGPDSAGASPGPAAYGRGGPLTVTDVNLYLGRIPEEQFPFPIDHAAIEQRLAEVISRVAALGISNSFDLCRGFRRIANEQMAAAVRTVSIQQGADPRSHALAGFGGAAGQHICEIADLLSIETILDAPQAGLLSALGMGCARKSAVGLLPVYAELDAIEWGGLLNRIAERQTQLRRDLERDGVEPSSLRESVYWELRYKGTDATLHVAASTDLGALDLSDFLRSGFSEQHQRRFGYQRKQAAIELVAVRCECDSPGQFQWSKSENFDATGNASPTPGNGALETKGWSTVPRAELQPGDVVNGPLIVLNEGSTLVVDPSWRARCLSNGVLQLTRKPDGKPSEAAADEAKKYSAQRVSATVCEEVDIVFRECLGARLQAIATQMGEVLQQTAISVNVKRRRDFSCAVFDARGSLLANAPHVPVHLGAMGETVRAVIKKFPNIGPGDQFITNDPYQGGSHLPDVSLVSPVFGDDPERPVMFVANRAHHADIGGIAPGSMSIEARTLGDEGVLIPLTRLTDGGASKQLASLFSASPYPPRNLDENLFDFAAQQAANQRGVELLNEYADSEGWERICVYSDHLLSVARQSLENLRKHLVDGEFQDTLVDGSVIRCQIRLQGGDRLLRIDFAGTSGVSEGNFNANPSIVKAAVIYVLRSLVADDIPLNEGILDAVELVLPRGLLNPGDGEASRNSPAVAAGNVETSQRIVDVLLGAFGVAAASQGTMNNFLFGNEKFGFYETIGGGTGATENSSGANAIHSHMTNTRLTDPEVLESSFPVRLTEFRVRPASGGDGLLSGGNGMIREFEFLDDVVVSLLTTRRGNISPFGLRGGEPGMPGVNLLVRNGEAEELAGCQTLAVRPGERIRLETPGGGGFGNSKSSPPRRESKVQREDA